MTDASVLIPLKVTLGLTLLLANFLTSWAIGPFREWLETRPFIHRHFRFATGVLLFAVTQLQVVPWSIQQLQARWADQGSTVALLAVGGGALLMMVLKAALGKEEARALHGPHVTFQEVLHKHQQTKSNNSTPAEKESIMMFTLEEDDDEDEVNPFTKVTTTIQQSGQPAAHVQQQQPAKKQNALRKRGAAVFRRCVPTLRALGGQAQGFLGGLAVGMQDGIFGVAVTAAAVLGMDGCHALEAGESPNYSWANNVLTSTAGGVMGMMGILVGLMAVDVRRYATESAVGAYWAAFDSGVILYVALVEMVLPQLREADHRGNLVRVVVLVSSFVFFGVMAIALL